MSKSQTYELFGYNLEEEPAEQWTPDNFAVFMARKLNAEKGSPFYEHIIVPAENDFSPSAAQAREAGDWAVSLATVVEGTVRMISANPKKDAYLMAGEDRYVGHERSVLPAGDPQRTPLRELYRECNDELIYTALGNFFQAVDKVFWRSAGPDSFIRKTVGIQALFDVARALLPEAIENRDLRTASFVEKLKPASHVDLQTAFSMPPVQAAR